MKEINQQILTGERALYDTHDAKITYCTFENGESPLKESSNLEVDNCLFKWKYPFWYTQHVKITNSALFEMARAGIWYVEDFTMEDTVVEAPKNFRRVNGLVLKNVSLPNAAETLWHCKNVKMQNVTANGDYFAMNSTDMEIDSFTLTGNYSFDGGKNIVVRNSRLLSKDAFWNAENITVYDSFISGEYLGWNSKNITLENCTIESLQGMCYIQNLTMKNCRLVNTTLAFEYSDCDVEIKGKVESVFNPKGGSIKADVIGELIMDERRIVIDQTKIDCAEISKKSNRAEWERPKEKN
ncbi:MAG: DUF3737 family protein [Treponema sp.]|nr:DUF3737 family protein [Treponema sp.]